MQQEAALFASFFTRVRFPKLRKTKFFGSQVLENMSSDGQFHYNAIVSRKCVTRLVFISPGRFLSIIISMSRTVVAEWPSMSFTQHAIAPYIFAQIRFLFSHLAPKFFRVTCFWKSLRAIDFLSYWEIRIFCNFSAFGILQDVFRTKSTVFKLRRCSWFVRSRNLGTFETAREQNDIFCGTDDTCSLTSLSLKYYRLFLTFASRRFFLAIYKSKFRWKKCRRFSNRVSEKMFIEIEVMVSGTNTNTGILRFVKPWFKNRELRNAKLDDVELLHFWWNSSIWMSVLE